MIVILSWFDKMQKHIFHPSDNLNNNKQANIVRE
jgi:hypothetical protein